MLKAEDHGLIANESKAGFFEQVTWWRLACFCPSSWPWLRYEKVGRGKMLRIEGEVSMGISRSRDVFRKRMG